MSWWLMCLVCQLILNEMSALLAPSASSSQTYRLLTVMENSFLCRHGRLTSERSPEPHSYLCCRATHGENVMLQHHVGCHAQERGFRGRAWMPLLALIGSQWHHWVQRRREKGADPTFPPSHRSVCCWISVSALKQQALSPQWAEWFKLRTHMSTHCRSTDETIWRAAV